MGAMLASFGAHLWLFEDYFASHPTQPHPESGLVHALNNHGSYVFISDVESTGLALLMLGFMTGFLVFVLIVPKEFELKFAGNPPWNKKTRVTLKNNSEFSPVEWFGFLGGIASGVSLIWLFGPMLVNFLVSHGFILNL